MPQIVSEPTTHLSPAANARHMVRCSLKGALATLDVATSAPYTSMILLATDISGCPLTLISTLARHTRNLAANPISSLMIDLSNAAGDAQSGGRITLAGRFLPVAADTAKVRFLARHPEAAGYAEFADFAFFRLEMASAHLIEGFGRIVTLPAKDLLPPGLNDADAFARREPAALADLRNRCARFATMICGLDSEGVDLRFADRSDRLSFQRPAENIEAAVAAAVDCLANAPLSTNR